ncbi:BCCT family transporter [Halomonas sp. McH1-25]|uniref:BCCT family transporter n=1 Tax=unclassified Halomonas TaxID=2609666 RepID=UPI001EF602FF|nr:MULTISPECIES: BCCT family transporter [unclassified Halomonas]MCG7599835.1 BCCT family transporter [Halomonas sp. McH1-25]MCP1341730.1 BCCT family transporter [Halomonas sp. FL8]MCP1362076.1 BCCT family transporter [Halomonas sp. BBD45]
MQTALRPLVFWPTFLILMAAVVASYVDLEAFLATASALNDAILDRFSWLFSLGSLYLLLLAVAVYFSPLGVIRIGGEQATPLLSRWRWFSITLCTTLAVGVLFWTTAEPLYHYMGPPASSGLEAGSSDAMLFAMSTMFLHWSFTPYAIYAVPALIFALAFYNLRLRFSISSMLEPLFGVGIRRFAGLIDAVALYALVAGMASTLGTGALTLAGGVGQYLGGETTPLRLGVIVAIIVVTFVISAASGLKKGISRLSALNAWLLLALGLFTFVVGPTIFMLQLGVESFGVYLDNFFTKSLFTGAAGDDQWPYWWSIFYWAIWFAWAPVSALFLGKISRGYTVREFLRVNLLYPALFASVWIIIFSGAALYFQAHTGVDLNAILSDQGVEHVLYELFRQLPLSGLWIPLLLFIAYISYVTAADSNTDAIGNLCTRGLTADSDLNAGLPMKVIWGTIVGIVSWVMVSFVGIDGVKMLSNLGGLPAMLIILLASSSLWIWLKDPAPLRDPIPAQKASHNQSVTNPSLATAVDKE